jgi:site-specific DNA-adenine methylase
MKKLKQLYRYVGGKAKLLKRYTPFFKGLRPEYCVDYFGGSGIMSVWFHHLYPEAKLYLNDNTSDILRL